jgi:hypothetical protein
MNRTKKEWLKTQIDLLEDNDHVQIYQIISKYTTTCTRSSNGVFVSSDDLSDECLSEIERHVLFCLDQKRRMEEDMKTRKTYERMLQ